MKDKKSDKELKKSLISLIYIVAFTSCYATFLLYVIINMILVLFEELSIALFGFFFGLALLLISIWIFYVLIRQIKELYKKITENYIKK